MTSSRGKRGRATYVLRGPIRTPSTARTPECAREGARYRFSVDLLNKKLTSAINPHSSIEKPPITMRRTGSGLQAQHIADGGGF